MKLSAQEEYGLRCLLFMARCGAGASLSIPEISRAEGLSVPNVAKLMRLLRLAGFVASARGQSGGYTLSRPAGQITVGEVMESLGGRFYSRNFCQRHSGVERTCTHASDCAVRSLWCNVQQMLEQILGKTTLQDLACSETEMGEFIGSHSEKTDGQAKVTQ